MNNTVIDSEQLKSVANEIKDDGNKILSQYTDECLSAMNLGRECLSASGLDVEAFFKSLEKTYFSLNARILEFSDFLNKKIADEYENLQSNILKNFDSNLSSELAGIVGISSASAVSGFPVAEVETIDTSVEEVVVPVETAPVATAPVLDDAPAVEVEVAQVLDTNPTIAVEDVPVAPVAEVESISNGV